MRTSEMKRTSRSTSCSESNLMPEHQPTPGNSPQMCFYLSIPGLGNIFLT